ncbi:MAG: biotin--[acetyl-CoA-carboxylase] ligase [Coriobacteriia bacterium]|nr:biotin--[acetyl-CoA-carboxylase] ligase [Coriobacteriia bacterium]
MRHAGTREHVLTGLRDAGAAGVSGESLAHMLGVSRVAVGKHVAALRELGYQVEAVPGSGYRLVAQPDLAYPWDVAPLVRHALWRSFSGDATLPSTNDAARELAAAGADEGTVVVAARQSAGRGRLGRSWESPAGGAYVSVILRPPVAPADAGSLALVVGLGIAQGLESVGVRPRLKWPNDVWMGEAKVAGVLLEMSAESDRVTWVVAGFGLNVVRPPDAPLVAAYVRDELPDANIAAVTASVLDGIAEAYGVWLDAGFGSLQEAYNERSLLNGRDVVVSDASGAVRVRGVARGVDDEGRLIVQGRAGTEAVSSGEATLRT